MSIQIITPALEQGSISSSGNQNSTRNVRSADYLILNGCASNAVITVQTVSGKSVQADLLGYEKSTSTSPKFDLYWYDSGHQFDIEKYPEVSYLRIVLKYEDGSDILPSDIAVCEIRVEVRSAWFIDSDGLPSNENFLPFPDDPLAGEIPKMRWRIAPTFNNGLPYHELLPLEKPSGAFMNAQNLEYAYIPRSCKKIGEWAFTNTKLRRVKIAADCEYYPTSFPNGCEIEFYGGGGEYGQLFDSDGYEIIDANGTRIYVKE